MIYTRRMVPYLRYLLLVAWFFPLAVDRISATELRIAVASNFVATMVKLSDDFTNISNHKLVISQGSTGKHYLQIRQGAPFDVFFAADREHPKLLESEDISVADSRMSYAFGRLVLWSPDEVVIEPRVLIEGDFSRIALANPKLAPYGLAAKQVLESLGALISVESKIVQGENIAQAYQFVASGNAELGFISLSQWQQSRQGSYWMVPPTLHQPIEQQLVLLNDLAAAWQLHDYMSSDRARKIIKQSGYATK